MSGAEPVGEPNRSAACGDRLVHFDHCHWQSEPEGRAVPERALDADASTLLLDQVANNTQPETQPAGRGAVEPGPGAEDALLVLRANTRAVVAHAHPQVLPALRDVQLDLVALNRVAAGVAEQIGDDLHHPRRVRHHGRTGRGRRATDALAAVL